MSTTPNSNRTTHTPGPWSHCGQDEPAGCRITIENGNGTAIAEVLNFDDFPCLDQHDDCEAKCEQIDAEAQANADLIAAAPETYEALKFVLAFYEPDAGAYLDTEAWKRAHAQAKAAIAKAEGR